MQVSLRGFALYCTETPLKEANLKIKSSLKTTKHEQKKNIFLTHSGMTVKTFWLISPAYPPHISSKLTDSTKTIRPSSYPAGNTNALSHQPCSTYVLCYTAQ